MDLSRVPFRGIRIRDLGLGLVLKQKTPHHNDEGFNFIVFRLIKIGTDLLSHILLQDHRLWRA